MKSKIILLPLLFLSFIYACDKQSFVTDKDARLEFSVDTLTFDTVFQSIGSATRIFTVKNPHNQSVEISSIVLARGNESCFRVNINGVPSVEIKNQVIGPNDSIYIFADVTIDPAENSLLEKDSLIFITNGNYQDVNFEAYGQDVHLINDSLLDTQTWTADKPYLITNSMAVDSNHTLTLTEGCHLHFSRHSRLIVLGTIIAEGSLNNPIIFEGDRLEHMYFDVPGQWGGIWLTKFSNNNVFNFTEIKNANIGIQVDSVQNSNPMLTIYNSKIEHHTQFGIFAQMSTVLGANLLFADCGQYAIALTRGGAYRFYHSTIANYWHSTIRNTPSVLVNNYFVHNGAAYVYNLNEAYFGNCIISGNQQTEFAADLYTDGVNANYMLDHCMLDLDDDSELNPDDVNHFINPIVNGSANFMSTQEYNFELDTLSMAKDVGSTEIVNELPSVLNTDLLNQSRLSDQAPDLGTYERVE
ncbi:MAG: hypothetical protein U9N85_01495 [Bacteroidota bacterium]|nr:hypothetical protein [Bacteroidota bacterium]